MKIPTMAEAESLLSEAEKLNPGPWVQHSLKVGEAGRAIASHHPDLDQDIAYVLGCLHDIGRRAGRTLARHIVDGYDFLAAKGYDDAARICLTHSFAIQDTNAISSGWDCTEAERRFVDDFIDRVEYTEYDRLFQLCDGLAMASGFCLIEKRLVDVVLRYGPNEYTVPKWKAILGLQEEFEEAIGQSVYRILPGVVENTFGFE